MPNSKFVLTKEDALRRQAIQLAHYEQHAPGITAYVKARTKADQLESGVEYLVHDVFKHIPLGWHIEQLIPQMQAEKVSTVKVYVLARDAGGACDIVCYDIECSQDEYALEDHRTMAINRAISDGYKTPMQAFLENEPAGIRMKKAAGIVDVELEDRIAQLMQDRIESGDLSVEDIPVRLARYGMMAPSDFVAEMNERCEMLAEESAVLQPNH